MMSFVGRFPCRTEKLNAKVLSDIQFHGAARKRESASAVTLKFGYLDSYNIYNFCFIPSKPGGMFPFEIFLIPFAVDFSSRFQLYFLEGELIMIKTLLFPRTRAFSQTNLQ